MIKVENLNKSFADKHVLHDICATFHNGKTNLIIGQSGSGKTVLMNCLVGLLSPTSGHIFYDNRDITTMSKQAQTMLRREIGMLFQGAALFDPLTVFPNATFPFELFSHQTHNEHTPPASFCLDRVNLIEAQNKFPN